MALPCILHLVQWKWFYLYKLCICLQEYTKKKPLSPSAFHLILVIEKKEMDKMKVEII